jgi:uncharacterized protein (DUF1684 family)
MTLFLARRSNQQASTCSPVRGGALLGLAAAVVTTVAACSSAPEQDYVSRISSERVQKDDYFRQSDQSPVNPPDRDKFLPLSYFPIDESYSVPAQLEPATSRERLQMPTSVGKLREVERVGRLKFSLKGQSLQLSAFIEDESGRLFVPFSDLTSGTETYQAGRYMNLDPTATGIYIIDFNIAYHPYCYYNETYDCPLPPAENRLAIPVRAGERLRKGDATVSR